jgi:diguanylate cyclase (GGDEF)-like protein
MALDALQGIPQPPAAVIEPRLLAAYGSAMAAALLGVLYVYRGRAFIVYWIVGWVLLAGSLYLASLGFRDTLAGAVVIGVAQVLALWSAGLLLLGAQAFPDAPLRWTAAIKVAAVSAVWFLVSPLAVPLHIVLVIGAAASAFLLTWACLLYLQLFRRTRHAGGAMIGIGMGLLATSSLAMAAFTLDGVVTGAIQNRALAFNAVVNIFVALGMHLLVFEDMTSELRRANRELATANEEVRRLAITDALTGCYNRRFFDQIERRELQRHRRYGSPLSVMFVDVNRFKHLNDTLGHDAGDAALRAIGELLRRNLRGSDYVIRWGGDEFLLLLTCTFAQAQHKAAELKEAFAADPATSALPGGVGLSAGAAQAAPDAQDLNDALRLADQRMYDDKFSARARVATQR